MFDVVYSGFISRLNFADKDDIIRNKQHNISIID